VVPPALDHRASSLDPALWRSIPTERRVPIGALQRLYRTTMFDRPAPGNDGCVAPDGAEEAPSGMSGVA
jgi:hypothetical protein